MEMESISTSASGEHEDNASEEGEIASGEERVIASVEEQNAGFPEGKAEQLQGKRLHWAG